MENPPASLEIECPVCLSRMDLEEQSGSNWLVCPNGCPTEIEAPQQELEIPAATAEAVEPKHKTAVA